MTRRIHAHDSTSSGISRLCGFVDCQTFCRSVTFAFILAPFLYPIVYMAGFVFGSHTQFRFGSAYKNLLTFCTVLTGSTVYLIYRHYTFKRHHVILPPPSNVSQLKNTDENGLPTLPGARDVTSPWGTTRIYEWGSLSGSRVLLIHGISTPSVGLRELAHGLVESGCRVMLFDLWGHGHSGTPPISMSHDMRLFTVQILLALTSSPISWTGNDVAGNKLRFSIVAYSMGAGIAVSFAVDQPELVHRIVLMAPGSLVRAMPWPYANPLALTARYGPSWLARWWMREVLGAGLPVEAATSGQRLDNGDGATEEARLWHWQLKHNPGFVHSFVSALRHAPIQHQHDTYRRLRDQLAAREVKGPNDQRVLVLLGGRDPYTLCDEMMTDALRLLGSEHAAFAVFEGEGHEFPRTRGQDMATVIWKFWNGEDVQAH